MCVWCKIHTKLYIIVFWLLILRGGRKKVAVLITTPCYPHIEILIQKSNMIFETQPPTRNVSSIIFYIELWWRRGDNESREQFPPERGRDTPSQLRRWISSWWLNEGWGAGRYHVGEISRRGSIIDGLLAAELFRNLWYYYSPIIVCVYCYIICVCE